MSSISRVRGDNYPIEAVIKVNRSPIDIEDGSVITFSYRLKTGGESKQIVGTPTQGQVGYVKFFPSDTDFQVSGIYDCDIQRTIEGVKTTHFIGTLSLTEDVTK